MSFKVALHKWASKGVWGSGENGYLFSRSLGALVIICRDLGSKLIVLVIEGALQKVKIKSHLKGKSFVSFDFFLNLRLLKGSPPRPPSVI